MKPSTSSEHNEQDRKVIQLLEDLGSLRSAYPPELLTARRAAFLTHVEQLTATDIEDELTSGEQEIVHLLGTLKSASLEYPPHLLAARRSELLQKIAQAETPHIFDSWRAFLHRIFSYQTTDSPVPGSIRISLVIASLLVVLFFGSLLFSRSEQAFQPSSLQGAATPTPLLPASTADTAITICKPDDPSSACSPGRSDSKQDLADPGNGSAQPAVSNDSVHKAAYVNDGRVGASWVSNAPDSWIKIDLGQVRTINVVSLKNGNTGSSSESKPGQFVIAVALSDVYADGDSNQDYTEYAQVFHSEQTGFSGRASQTETIQTQFLPVQARYVKITFEQAGAAIDEVGVFMVGPATPTSPENMPETTLTLALSPTNTATFASIATQLTPDTAAATSTDTSAQADTPTPLPTNTLPPVDTFTPVPTEPLPSDTPVPLPTFVPLTEVPPTAQQPPVGTDPIVVTGNGHTLTFTCNGNAAEIRGHENIVTLLGSCSSITVTGNRNTVFWQSGSPVITNKGRDNVIRQL